VVSVHALPLPGVARVFDSAKRPGGKGIMPNVEMPAASETENHLCFPAKVIIFFTG
jgi:hypothetical protein